MAAHGFKSVLILVSVPVVAAFAGGAFLAHVALESRATSDTARAAEELTSQAKGLADAVQGEIDAIRVRALSLQRIRAAEPAALPEVPILEWAEFDLTDGGQLGRVRARARGAEALSITPAFEDFLWSGVARGLPTQTLAKDGMAAMRVKQDPARGEEWLALAFQGARGTAVVALVDPAAFTAFRRWSARSEGGSLRAYLVAADGIVLAHSQSAYVGADFSQVPVFARAVKKMLDGERLSGAGNFDAIDRLPVSAAYVRAGTLPLGVVAERVIAKPALASALFSAPARLGELGISGLQVFSALALLCAGVAFWIRRWIRGAALRAANEALAEVPEVDSETDEAEPGLAPADSVAGPGAPAGATSRATASGSMELESLPAMLATAGSSLAVTGGRGAEAPWIESELVGNPDGKQLEGGASEKVIASVQREREDEQLIAELEAELARSARGTDTGRRVGQQLARSANRLLGCRTLFFAYHSSVGSAILATYAGFVGNEAPTGMAFPLTAPALAHLASCGSEGAIASFAEYPPLSRLLLSRFNCLRFDAWAVQDAGAAPSKDDKAGPNHLLGVLVALNPGDQVNEREPTLARLLQSAERRAAPRDA
jgi:hypothetical protein